MRAAVDSSLLLDVLLDDPDHAMTSQALLDQHAAHGALLICPVAYAEVAAALNPSSSFLEISTQMGLVYDDLTPEVAVLAAQMWQEYRRRGGPRLRILSDFLIGAHAQLRAERLLTRDRGYYRDYFQGLHVESPD